MIYLKNCRICQSKEHNYIKGFTVVSVGTIAAGCINSGVSKLVKSSKNDKKDKANTDHHSGEQNSETDNPNDPEKKKKGFCLLGITCFLNFYLCWSIIIFRKCKPSL